MLQTNCAYSEGEPKRCGNGTDLLKNALTLSGNDDNNGVLNKPINNQYYVIYYMT